MQNTNTIIKKLDMYIPAAKIFQVLPSEENAIFLDSSLVNELGHYSIIGRKPYLKLEKREDRFYINDTEETSISFENYLRSYLDKQKTANSSHLPLASGALGYFSYEYGRRLMGIPSSHKDTISIPDAVLIFYDAFIIEDCHKKESYLITNGITEPADILLKKLEDAILKTSDSEPVKPVKEKYPIQVHANFEKEDYKKSISDMIHYIYEGDIYIANMTQQLTIESKKAPQDVFYNLRKNNPSPFGGYLDFDHYQIVCASPERFLKLTDGHVETRPIKGTRKRGETEKEDLRLRKELENSEKDKSELLMIVDLERNDLNKICRSGSVKVTDLFTIEEYATVFHLASGIEGDLADEKNFADLLMATFPGGSITGAPKYRAMEVIDELEHGKRNLYTGSIGYLSLDGNCDFNIVIRTVLHVDGHYHLGVGGGITAESETEFEYEETLQKAKAILDALQ